MARRIQILLVEDNANDAELVLAALRRAQLDPEWHRVEDEEDYVRSLRPGLDLIISDYEMPSFNGLRALSLLKERGYDIPFILVSGSIGEEIAVEAIKQGATDYLLKDRLGRLGAAATQALEQGRLRRENKRAEEALHKESEFISAVINTAGSLVIVVDREGRIIRFNRACEQLSGYTFDEVKGKNFMDFLLTPEERQGVKGVFEKICAGQFPNIYENLWVTKDGKKRLIAWSNSALLNAKGKVEYAIGTGVDITERRQTEQETQRVSRQMQLLLESAGEGIYGVDTQGLCTFINRAAVEMFGYTREQALGQDMHRLVHHHFEDGYVHPAEECPILRAMKRNEKCRVDMDVFWRADGTFFPVEYSSHPIVENGVTTGAVVTFSDITERRRSEEQIEEQAALLDNAQDAIIVRDLNGAVLFWNKGAERMYGWTRAEAMAHNIGDLLYSDAGKFKDINRVILNRGEWSGEVLHLTKDKRELSVQARSTLVWDKAGRPKSVLAINTDITEKKKIEAQFMRAQRTESIGTLAGGIAHDLNNILTPIMMSIEMLKQNASDPMTNRILDTVEVSCRRGASIVQQVLSFARGLEGERIEVDPKHLVKDVGTIIKDSFPKNIRIERFLPDDSWTVQGDPTQLHQILLNLCVNARDAMPAGGTLTITVENIALDEQYAAMHLEAKAGRYVILSVTDSGTGILPAILDKIFEPFFTTKEVGHGTGLGLSTVSAIVKSHAGFINVYSEQGRGTTFKVYLPAMDIFSDGHRTEKEVISLPRGNGETILLVDDEASILTITGQTLDAFGYRVLTASDGAEAVAVYAQHRDKIAVVLTDMAMPIMDGTATIRALMKINPAVRIIGASGLKTNDSMGKEFNSGIKHFLTKPYTAETLLKTLQAALTEV